MIDLRTLPLSEQHHPLAFNDLGRIGRRATDFLWICPVCDEAIADSEGQCPYCGTKAP